MCIGTTTEKRQSWEEKSIFLPFLGHEETPAKATSKFFTEEKVCRNCQKSRKAFIM